MVKNLQHANSWINSQSSVPETSISRCLELTIQTKWITLCERVGKTLPENGVVRLFAFLFEVTCVYVSLERFGLMITLSLDGNFSPTNHLPDSICTFSGHTLWPMSILMSYGWELHLESSPPQTCMDDPLDNHNWHWHQLHTALNMNNELIHSNSSFLKLNRYRKL